MMFAQATAPDSVTAWNVVLTIGVLVAIAANVIALLRTKQKREVSFTFEPASKQEFDQFSATTNQNFVSIRAEISRERSANEVHASARSKTIYDKMESVRTELDSKVEDTRRELSDKIDAMPATIITTLKNTGALDRR